MNIRINNFFSRLIFVSLIMILLLSFVPGFEKSIKQFLPVFCFEWLALFSFGLSWLVKGELILKDKTIANTD